MQGSLCLHRGVLWVGRHELTAHVRPFDLDGHPLGEGFSFRGEGGAPASAAGIAASGEHTLWIAETSGGRVQGFNVFGRETRALGRGLGAERDAPGSTAGALDVAVLEEEDEPARIVACFEGERRHGVQVFDPEGPWIESLRSEGSPLKSFTDARRLGVQGRLLYGGARAAFRSSATATSTSRSASPPRRGTRSSPRRSSPSRTATCWSRPAGPPRACS